MITHLLEEDVVTTGREKKCR